MKIEKNYLVPYLKEKIIDSNARSIYINAHPRKSISRIEVIALKHLKEGLDPLSITNNLISNRPFEYNFPIHFNKLSENRNARRLLHLLRKNNDFTNELNLDPFGIGYPIIEIADKRHKRINSIPILIWDVQISGHLKRSGAIRINRKSTDEILINPSLVSLIKSNYDAAFEVPILESIKLDFTLLLKIINNVLFTLGCMPLNENHRFYSLDAFEELPPKYYSTHKPKLINNGVFGLYVSSKESIISDYSTLEQKSIPCHFEMKQNLNDSLYTGVALDHSQQRVIRTLNKNANTVIHGPPGTGKSKTLTAIISYILSKGQTCLIVCEKKTAIDVLNENLSKIGFDEFCINISDVKKDRRNVINKIRKIIVQIKEEHQIFTKALDSKKEEYSIAKEKLIYQKIEKVNEVISLINKTKKRLNKPIIGDKLSYSDLVIAIKNNRYKSLTTSLNLNVKEFQFNIEEFSRLKVLFKTISTFFDEKLNPYDSFFESVNTRIYCFDEQEFNDLISIIYSSYFLKLRELGKRLEKALIGKNRFAFKYINYVDSDDVELNQIQKEFIFYIAKIEKEGIFSKSFSNSIQSVTLNKQIKLIADTIQFIYENKEDFKTLKSFNNKLLELTSNEKTLIKKLGILEAFSIDFFDWYYSHLLDQNSIDNFDFNGIEKGYYDIESDVKHINDFILTKTNDRLKKNRLNGILNFKETEEKLTIEQFFSKKSLSNRIKPSLTKISNHNSGILKSFFPVFMTNPSSCSSLFPLEKGYFDYVIYDESSQLKIEDTFPSMIRGKVSIVAGDIHQLPPMDYFIKNKDAYDNIDKLKSKNSRSLLDYCISNNFKSHYLDIHYRSKHPDLINFSNAAFYKSRLIAQPSSEAYCSIEFHSSKGKFINRINRKEAKDIVDYIEDNIGEDKSVGVATFSLLQREEVLNQLELRSKLNSSFYNKLISLKENGFFVKNIENIQGEERDVIIIGTTYGVNKEGNFMHKLGPINTKKRGHKLLNVIITRAIEKTIIFSSIPSAIFSNYEFLIYENGNRGKSILFAYLAYSKAVSQNDRNKIESLLNFISETKNDLYKNKLNSVDLESFSLYITNKLINISNQKLGFQNNIQIGGYIFELEITSAVGETLLIDINGKDAYQGYEDYIFDIDRTAIAKKVNNKYYRLWLSNFYNNQEFEINKIIKLLEE